MRGDKAPGRYTTGPWPHEAQPVPQAPPGVHYALALAREIDLIAEQRGLSHRAISRLAGLNETAVGTIVRGQVYPDLATIARLEQALDGDLLPPGRPRTLLPRDTNDGAPQ
ncbi:helix-turn-helix domain-containing protein [Kitasatospora purpeofusca]|uniref:helix-turn-helix domain-containing protein n=1 Tax=Kitasatospora purpeofusca TaxID=67352 RepID=UPI0035DCCCC3